MRKVAVYAGTRNVYHNMTVAAKSLLSHTPMNRVWFLIEDDQFPEQLPDVIRCINVSGQQWFDPKNVNCRKRWSYMSLMRLVLTQLLPEEHLVLWLDIDTIVNVNLTELFRTDLEGCPIAAVEEPMRSRVPFRYFNAGVMLMDLDQIRGGLDRELIGTVNSRELDFPDQDAINLRCQGRIKAISPYWNSNYWIVEVDNPGITHYAADREYTRHDLWKKYDGMDWRVIDADED